jgi:hypothetical protein
MVLKDMEIVAYLSKLSSVFNRCLVKKMRRIKGEKRKVKSEN